MPRLGLVIDLKRCIGCNACTVACKQEHGAPPGVHFARVVIREVGRYPKSKRTFLPVLCNHCEDAPCVDACPSGASYRRPDGIVMADKDKCIGCRACAVACPYQNRHYVEKGMLDGYAGRRTPFETLKFVAFDNGTMSKCNLCAHRVDQGLEPACVITCPAEARNFGDLDEAEGKLQKLLEARKNWTLLPEADTRPRVFYLDE